MRKFISQRVLIVDDDPDIAELIADMLKLLEEKFPTEIHFAQTYMLALDAILKAHEAKKLYDIIFLDGYLDDPFTGKHIMQYLEEFPFLKEKSTIIANSGRDAFNYILIDMGADYYLGKPFDCERVEELMETIMQNKGDVKKAQPIDVEWDDEGNPEIKEEG